MLSAFKNILVPVDFSKNADLAIKKAIEFAAPVDASIHLLHISSPPAYYSSYALYGYCRYTPESSEWYFKKIEKKMSSYEQEIKNSLPLAEVNTHITTDGSVQDNIIELANISKIELIIIGKSKSRKWFPFLNTVDPSFIAKSTNSVVLTVKPGAVNNRIKTIVFPVTSVFPQRKIELLKILTERNGTKIHLVTIQDKTTQPGIFVDTYRTISEYMHYPIEYEILESNNLPKAIFNYAKKVSADLILTNPYTETKTNAVYGTDICDLISPTSKLSVLTAEPFHS